jgi:predicted PurR-regulated permease PerM
MMSANEPGSGEEDNVERRQAPGADSAGSAAGADTADTATQAGLHTGGADPEPGTAERAATAAAATLDELLPGPRWPLIVGVIAAGILLFYLLQPILLPFVLGALLGYLGDPLVDRVEARGGSRTFGVLLVFLMFSSILLLAVGFAVPLLLQQLDGLVSSVPKLYAWVRDVALPWLQSRTLITGARLPQIDWSAELLSNWQSLGKVTAQTVSRLTGSGLNLLLSLANAVLIPVVAFYLMRDWDDIMQRLLHLFPRDWQRNTRVMVGEADEVVGAFLRGQFVVMCALGAIYTLGLWLVGVQMALLLGFVAGLASLVPYMGFIVGIGASLLVAWMQFQDWLPLLWVALVFGAGQLVESFVLTPILVGDRIGLHPVGVIFALMAGGQLAGFVGVVLALPVAAVIMVFARHALQHYRASHLYDRD